MLLQTKIANTDQNKYFKETHLALDRCALVYNTKQMIHRNEYICIQKVDFFFLLWSFTSLCLCKLSDFVQLIATKWPKKL